MSDNPIALSLFRRSEPWTLVFVLLAPQLQRVNDANQWSSQQHRRRENAAHLKVRE